MSPGENPTETIAMDEVEELVEKILDCSMNDSSSKMDWDFVGPRCQPPTHLKYYSLSLSISQGIIDSHTEMPI